MQDSADLGVALLFVTGGFVLVLVLVLDWTELSKQMSATSKSAASVCLLNHPLIDGHVSNVEGVPDE